MEKAMQNARGIGFAEYERSLDKRIQIEKIRDKEHRQCAIMLASFKG
jgi:hypothetical protein